MPILKCPQKLVETGQIALLNFSLPALKTMLSLLMAQRRVENSGEFFA